MKAEVSDDELKKVIGDFLEMGHVDNIVAMFRRYPDYYSWTGEILDDERLAVRLGVSILFEELKAIQPENIHLAVPSLKPLLHSDSPMTRGEAVGLLGIIGTDESFHLIRTLASDPNPQVREMVELALEDEQ
jgi:HEAT repeat protein